MISHNLINIITLTAVLSITSLITNTNAFTITTPQSITARTTTTTRLHTSPPITTSDIVALFGRLGDRAYVPPPSDVQGTAASGYEFGVMEAGRPKWLCTYEERSGQTQGGGKMMSHVPNWKGVLFGEGEGGLGGVEALKVAMGAEDVKFQMPMAAPSGGQIKTDAAEPPTSDAVVNTLWTFLGGDSGGTTTLTAADVSTALQSTAGSNGSSTEDHLTYAVFEKAFMAAAASTVDV